MSRHRKTSHPLLQGQNKVIVASILWRDAMARGTDHNNDVDPSFALATGQLTGIDYDKRCVRIGQTVFTDLPIRENLAIPFEAIHNIELAALPLPKEMERDEVLQRIISPVLAALQRARMYTEG